MYRITKNTTYIFHKIPNPNYNLSVLPEGEDFLKNGEFEILEKNDYKRDTDCSLSGKLIS